MNFIQTGERVLKIKTWKTYSMFFVMIIVLCFPAVTHAEKINSFVSDIQIHSDASISVTEKIQYDFESESRHGIFRTIPLNNNDGSEISIDNISVKDQNGSMYQFQKSVDTNSLTVKIGDPNKTVSGLHEYIISYTVKNALVSFDNYDELYWNVNGNNWNVPIENIVTKVSFDTITGSQIKQYACYQGIRGSKNTCDITVVNNTLESHVSNLSPNVGVTVAVGVEKGVIAGITRIGGQINNTATTGEPVKMTTKIIYVIIGCIVIFGAIFFRFKIRDPRSKNPVVAWYEPPANLSPIITGTLVDKKLDGQDVTGQILSLAERGYITITQIYKKGSLKLFNSIDYIFEVVKDTSDLDFIGDTEVLKIIFGSEKPAVGEKSNLSSISEKENTISSFNLLQKSMDKVLVEQGFSQKNNLFRNVFIIHMSLVGITLLDYYLITHNNSNLPWNLIPGIAAVIVMFIIGKPKQQYTNNGADIKQQILGFKDFLSTTDRDRFDFHNAPEKSPTQFMKYLPYAIVLGVEKKWAEQFKGITISNPVWYNGPSNHVFIASEFATHMTAIGEDISSAVTPASSGSSGGGFSGGGSGGGGGGSW